MAARDPHVLEHLALAAEVQGILHVLDAENTTPIRRYSGTINITNEECSTVLD